MYGKSTVIITAGLVREWIQAMTNSTEADLHLTRLLVNVAGWPPNRIARKINKYLQDELLVHRLEAGAIESTVPPGDKIPYINRQQMPLTSSFVSLLFKRSGSVAGPMRTDFAVYLCQRAPP